MFGLFEKKKADVLSHWYALIPNFNTSTKEFYDAIEQELKAREVPGLEFFHVDFAEGGVLSAKREYLRMTRERLVFDICAAPFGTAYFFSCRFAEIPAVIQLWQLIVLLLVFGICFPLSFVVCARIFGMLGGAARSAASDWAISCTTYSATCNSVDRWHESGGKGSTNVRYVRSRT